MYDGLYRKTLKRLSRLETAADDWWDQLTPEEKQAYLKVHPRSKYGRPAKPPITPKPDPEKDTYKPVNRRHLKRISLPPSQYAGDHAAGIEGRIKWHMDNGDYAKVVSVDPENLRATQGWVDKRWTPEWSKGTSLPVGMIDDKGIVHLLDGHHRGNNANLTHRKIKVRVVGPHTKKHEAAYQRVKSQYGE